jgi:hypothetical protein
MSEAFVIPGRLCILKLPYEHSAGILEQSMGARNRVGIGLSHWPARLHRLAESIPGLLKSLKISALITCGSSVISLLQLSQINFLLVKELFSENHCAKVS